MPGGGNQQHNQRATQEPQPPPGSVGKQLFGKTKVDQGGCNRKHKADQTFEQEPGAQARRKNGRPESRPLFLFIQRAQEGPHRKCNGKCEHHIGDLNAREKK